jgi:hypothetical protein
MTITVTFEKLGTTAVADVDLQALDQTKLAHVGTTKSNGFSTSEYVLADGSLDYDVNVYVNRTYNPKANSGFGETTYSITIAGTITVVDDVLLTKLAYPGWVKLSWAWPGQGIGSVTELRQMLNNAFCLTFPSVAAGVISDAFLTSLAYDLTNIYG